MVEGVMVEGSEKWRMLCCVGKNFEKIQDVYCNCKKYLEIIQVMREKVLKGYVFFLRREEGRVWDGYKVERCVFSYFLDEFVYLKYSY